jgi:tetratricopeptide (TPR) repeat protein
LVCAPSDLRDVARATPIAERAVKLSEGKSSAILDTLALAYHRAGRNDQAVELQKKSLDLLPRESRREVIYSANLVRYLQKQGDIASADRVILEGVEMFRQALGEDNPRLAADFNKAGVQLAESGCYAMAERLLSEALELNRNILGEEHEQVAVTLKNLADVYHLLGDYHSAESNYRQALAKHRRLLGDDDVAVAETMHALGATLHHGGNPVEAAATMEQVLDVYRRLDAQDIPAALICQRHLAQVLVELGQLERAGPLAHEVLTKAQTLFGEDHLATAQAMMTKGQLMIELDQTAQAESLLRKCVDLHDRLDLPEGQGWLSAQARGTLGHCLLAQRRFDEAEPLLLECFEALKAARGPSFAGTRAARDRLVALYQAWGKPDQVARWEGELAVTARPGSD